MSAAVIVAVSDVAVTNVVARALPLTRTTDDGRKFWPVAVRVKPLPPAAAVDGVMPLRMGAAGGAVTESDTLLDVQPVEAHGEGLVTWIGTDPAVATSAAVTLMSSCVPLTKLTERAVPPTVAVAPLANPMPVARSVKLLRPATTLEGVRPVMVGVELRLATVSVLLVAARPPLARNNRTSYEPGEVGIVVVHVRVAVPGKLDAYTQAP
jgi:hypothetical protein